MNRTLQYINFFGVLALAGLCVVQWQRDRKLNLDINALEKTRVAQEQKISEQSNTVHGLTRDLELFKNQFSEEHSNSVAARDALEKAELENSRLKQERDQLQVGITNWKNAVTLRDARLGEMDQQLRTVTEKANESVHKFNDLATNYNSVVEELNTLRKQNAAAAAPAKKAE